MGRRCSQRKIHTRPVDFSQQEHALYEDITDYLQNDYRLGEEQESHTAGFSMVIYQKRLVSSIRAIQRSLEKRARVLRNGGQQEELSQLVKKLLPEYRERPETLTDKQRERIEDELQKVSTGQDPEQLNQELEVLEGLIERTRSIEVDSKAQELREFIESLLNEDPDEKVLVFTEYTDTFEYLRDEVI